MYILSLLLFCAIPAVIIAQTPAKTLWVQAAGNSGMLAVQFDTRLGKSIPQAGVMAGAGLIADPTATGFSVPAGFYWLAGAKGHYLELGAGATFFHFPKRNQDSWFNFEKENFLAPQVSLGYRSEAPGKRRYFRAGLSYFLTDLGLPKIAGIRNLVPGLSLGWKL